MNDSMKANINFGGQHETFVGESEFEIRRVDDRYQVIARHDKPEGDRHYLSFSVPGNIAGDGSPVTLSLVPNPTMPGQARGDHMRFGSDGGFLLPSRTGTLVLRFNAQTEQMTGTFNFETLLGDTPVSISDGIFDITGITDGIVDATATGTFTAESAWEQFRAEELSITPQDMPVDPEPYRYWEVLGRMIVNDVVPLRSQITLYIKDHVKPGTHNLKGNPDVWASYFRTRGGIFHAVAGTLTFDSHPNTGHIRGTLAADFAADGNPVHVTGEFDIRSL